MKANEKHFELARIRVIGINLSEVLIKGKEILFELARDSSYPSSSYRGSTDVYISFGVVGITKKIRTLF